MAALRSTPSPTRPARRRPRPAERVSTRLLKRFSVVLLSLAAGAGLAAWLYYSGQPWHPVARVAAPDGISYTALSDPTPDHEGCLAANARFLQPVRAQCGACAVVYERCERKAEAQALRRAESARTGTLLVRVPGLQLLIAGPPALALASCRLIAADLEKRGIAGGRCALPADASPG